MAVRKIEYTVNADGIEPAVKRFAGVQNEHKATELVFNIQNQLYEDLIAQSEEYSARLIYRFDGYDGEGGVCRSDTSELIGTQVTYPLEEWLTRFGGVVKVVLVISILKENLTEMELYSFPALLQLKNLPSGADLDKTEYESLTTLAESAKSAADKLFGDNVFVFGGGNAYDENIWPPTTDEVHNPEVNLVQSKRPITSKGVYAAFKAFYERIIQAIDDKFALHKDYIVEEGTTEDECWAEVSGTGNAVGINTMTIQFPLYFISGEFRVNATPARNATQISWYGECNGAGNPQRGSGYCYFSYKLTSKHNPTFNVHVVGTWKR